MMKLCTHLLRYTGIWSLCLPLFLHASSAEEDIWNGKHYVNNSELQYQWATSYINKLNLEGHEAILDIGCGDGRITAVIANALPSSSVVGIDASDSMLEVAHALQKKIQLGNLQFFKRNALNLNFENAFDYIVSFSCFHWINDHFIALQEMAKALKAGGKIFLYFTPDHESHRIDHAIDSVVHSPKWAHYFTEFSNPFSLITPLNLITYANEVGLLFKRVENIVVHEVFPDKAAFATWMTGWLSHLKHLPKSLHAEFLEEIIDSYLIHHPLDSENKLHYIGYWLEAELFKPM